MRGSGLALRIAWREARRAKGCAALVVGMIMLPVAALSFTAVSYDTFTLTPAERAERAMGTTQAAISWPYSSPVVQEPDRLFALSSGEAAGQSEPTEEQLKSFLPNGTRLIPNHTSGLTLDTLAGTSTFQARLLDYTAPQAAGVLRSLSGRAPASDDEVALTPQAVSRTGAGVGGTVRTGDDKTLRVVGIVEDPDDINSSTVVLRPGVLPVDRSGLSWLAEMPSSLTWAQVKELNKHGVAALSRHVLENPPPVEDRYREIGGSGSDIEAGVLALVAGLAILEIVLLAGPALAVGARRRRHDLALVAASGGTPAHVRRIVLADGLVLGALAAVTGVVLGVVVAVAGHGVVERFSETRSGAFRLFPTALAVLALLAVVTGVLAALVPAWVSSRQDVVTALAGRRGITRSRRRWLVAGFVLIALGVVTAIIGAWQVELAIVLAGLALGELGLVLITPSLVGLVARLGKGLPVPVRIALRDAARNRSAAAPAISAVMAVVVGSLAVGVVLASDMGREASQSAGNVGDVALYHVPETNKMGQAIPASVVDTLRRTLPVAEAHEIKLLSCEGGPCFAHPRPPAARECPYGLDLLGREPTEDEQIAARADSRCDGVGAQRLYFNALSTPVGLVVVIKPEAAGAVTGLSADDAAVVSAALREGKFVVDDPNLLENGNALVGIGIVSDSTPPRTISTAAVAMPQRPRAPIALMTEETAKSLGFGATTFTVYATTTRVPTVEEQDRLQAALQGEYEVSVERTVRSDVQRTLTVLAVVAAVITLGAAALATGLAAADGRADLTTLAAVGASPTLRRLLSLSQSGVIAGLGSLLGTAAGLATSVAVLTALNQRFADQWPPPTPYPITVPWLNVAVALILVPVVAMLGSALLTRSRLPIERRS